MCGEIALYLYIIQKLTIMGDFDFLDNIGESKGLFKKVKVSNKIEEAVKYLEILQNRNLMGEDFKNDLLELMVNKKANSEVILGNINKSIEAHEKIKLKILSIDEEMFKSKNDQLEYVGAIDRMPNDATQLLPNRGKVSYLLVQQIFNVLKNRTVTIKEIINLSDILDFKVLAVFNVEVSE